MDVNRIKGYCIGIILFILFNITAFAIPTTRTTTFWITYVFTIIAFIAQIFIWNFALEKAKNLQHRLWSFSIIYIGIVYLVLQIIVFFLFRIIATLPTWSAIVVSVIISGISIASILASESGVNEIKQNEIKVQNKISFIRVLQTEIDLLINREKDDDVRLALENLAQKIRFSDPMSSEQLKVLENEIDSKVSDLKIATNKKELIDIINLLLDERNIKCKMIK